MPTVENPYAFPGDGPTLNDEGSGFEYNYLGMTLRDYFAAKAMQAMVSLGSEGDPEWTAKDAYRMADAMLKTRES